MNLKRAAVVTAVLSAVLLGYVAGTNAAWVSNAVYVSRVTHSPLMQVLAPLHRHWLDTAGAPFHIETVDDNDENRDDELLARTVESEQG